MIIVESGFNWALIPCSNEHGIEYPTVGYSSKGRVFGYTCPVCRKHYVISQMPTFHTVWNGVEIIVANNVTNYYWKVGVEHGFSDSLRAAKIAAYKLAAITVFGNKAGIPIPEMQWDRRKVVIVDDDYMDFCIGIGLDRIRTSCIFYKGVIYIGESHYKIISQMPCLKHGKHLSIIYNAIDEKIISIIY